MEIHLRLVDPTPDALKELAAFLERHRESVVAAEDAAAARWSVETARMYVRRLPPRAQQIIMLLAHSGFDGVCPADDVRAELGVGSLRGSTAAFQRVLTAGEYDGHWPRGLPVPVESLSRGGQVTDFQIANKVDHPDLLNVFKAAVESLSPQR